MTPILPTSIYYQIAFKQVLLVKITKKINQSTAASCSLPWCFICWECFIVNCQAHNRLVTLMSNPSHSSSLMSTHKYTKSLKWMHWSAAAFFFKSIIQNSLRVLWNLLSSSLYYQVDLQCRCPDLKWQISRLPQGICTENSVACKSCLDLKKLNQMNSGLPRINCTCSSALYIL